MGWFTINQTAPVCDTRLWGRIQHPCHHQSCLFVLVAPKGPEWFAHLPFTSPNPGLQYVPSQLQMNKIAKTLCDLEWVMWPFRSSWGFVILGEGDEHLDQTVSKFHENTGHPCACDSKSIPFIFVNELWKCPWLLFRPWGFRSALKEKEKKKKKL